MAGANFCQGCGRPVRASAKAASSSPDQPSGKPRAETTSKPSSPQEAAARTCFRCSAPLAAGANVCGACGLDVASLFGPETAKPVDPPVDLRELTFFNRSPPPDPQFVALKTYAGWLAVAVFVLIGSFAAYSWLEASNVISRLIGGNADLFSAQAEKPQRTVVRHPVQPAPVPTDAPQVTVALPKGDRPEMESSRIDDAKSLPVAGQSQPPVDVEARTQSATSPPRMTVKSATAAPQVDRADSVAPVVTPQAEDAAPAAAPVATAPKIEPAPKPRRSVVVTQIEPNRNGSSPRSELEAFLRSWKKSFRQGVSDRPCTQQERALNQCN